MGLVQELSVKSTTMALVLQDLNQVFYGILKNQTQNKHYFWKVQLGKLYTKEDILSITKSEIRPVLSTSEKRASFTEH